MSAAERFAGREPLTQSLACVAAMQQRGWAPLLVGGGVMIPRPSESGIVARIQRPRAIDLRQVDAVAERTGLSRVLVEPALVVSVTGRDGARALGRIGIDATQSLLDHGLTPAEPVAHTKTAIVDLHGGTKAVLDRCSASTRRNARIDERHPALSYSAIPCCDIGPDELSAIEALFGDFVGARPWLDNDWPIKLAIIEQFASRGKFVLAHYRGELVGVVLVLMHDRVASYFSAFCRDDVNALRVPTGLVIECVRQALADGCDLLDFVGLFDERYPDRYRRWRGFSTFKLRFGAVPIELPHPVQLQYR